jgi:hypothetical protein
MIIQFRYKMCRQTNALLKKKRTLIIDEALPEEIAKVLE